MDSGSRGKRFDGSNAEEYMPWKRWLRNHLKAKKVDEDVRGPTVICQLDGAALVACENIEQEELEAPGGEELVFVILDERYRKVPRTTRSQRP